MTKPATLRRMGRHLRAGPDAGRRATGRGPPGHPAAGRYACWSIRLLADTLACGVAARGHELAETLTAYARRRSSTEQSTATLLAGPGRADVALAALANVSAVRMFDANDIYCPPPGDDRGPFSDAIPALLADAEVAGRTGAEALTAIIAVYEIQALLCAATPWNPSGWHTASLGAWSIPAPVVRLWQGSLDQAVMATSLAGTTGQALQSWLRPGLPVTALKSVGPGLCAQRSAEVHQPAGHPDGPLSDEQLPAKLDEILAGRLGDGGARRLLTACDALPDAPDLTDLVAVMTPAESPSELGRR